VEFSSAGPYTCSLFCTSACLVVLPDSVVKLTFSLYQEIEPESLE